MMKSILFGFCLVAVLSACDSGDIETQYSTLRSGQTVKLTAMVVGAKDWPDKYSLALAGFNGETNYAVVQKTLPSFTEDSTCVELILGNLAEQVTDVEFAVTNKLRERILSLERIRLEDYPETTDTICMDLGVVDVSLFGCLQNGVFNQACVQCHGGNGRSAADLNLTPDYAFSQLVGVPSSRIDGLCRVVGGEPSRSVLYKILTEGEENLLTYNHTEILNSQFKDNRRGVLDVIEEWIKSLD